MIKNSQTFYASVLAFALFLAIEGKEEGETTESVSSPIN